MLTKKKGGTLYASTAVRKVNVKVGDQTEIVTDKETLRAQYVVIAVPIWQLLKILSMDEMAKYVPQWAARMLTLERETSSSMGFTIGTKAPLLKDPYSFLHGVFPVWTFPCRYSCILISTTPSLLRITRLPSSAPAAHLMKRRIKSLGKKHCLPSGNWLQENVP